MHWAARRNRLKPWRQLTELYASVAVNPTPAPIVVRVTLTFARNGRRDPHNYSSTVVKTIIDALVAAGVVPDDTAEWVTVMDPVLAVAKDNRCRVEIVRIEK